MHIPRRGAAESAARNGASLAAAGRHPLGRHRILASLGGARAARDATATTGPAQGRRQPEEVVGRLSWPPVSFQTKCETSPIGTSRQFAAAHECFIRMAPQSALARIAFPRSEAAYAAS